jgi:hypothetical protein
MLKDDVFTFCCIWFAIELVRFITPVSIAVTVLRFCGVDRFRASQRIEHVALVETLFYLCFYLPRRYSLDSLPPEFTDRSRDERRELFHKCLSTVPNVEQWLSIWFKETDFASLRTDDVKLFLAWGFLNKTCIEQCDFEELDEYVGFLERLMGRRLEPGGSPLQPCRVSTDMMGLQHKSLLCYAVRRNCLTDARRC